MKQRAITGDICNLTAFATLVTDHKYKQMKLQSTIDKNLSTRLALLTLNFSGYNQFWVEVHGNSAEIH